MTTGSQPDAGGSAGDESVEVLGPDGEVVDVVSRRRMRLQGLAHRSTFIITVVAEPPPAKTIDPLLPDRVEEWLGSLAWPLLGPGGDADGRPAPAPAALRPSVRLSTGTQMIVHRRADWKDVYPGYWDLAFGGVCVAGEPWLASAERELTEEAGLPTRTTAAGPQQHTVAVLPVAAGRYVDDRAETFGAIFVAFADRDPEPADGEVVALDRIALGELETWIDDRLICPDSRAMVVPVVSTLLESPGSSR